MAYHQDLRGCIASEKEANRLSEQAFGVALDACSGVLRRLRHSYEAGKLPLRRRGHQGPSFPEIGELAEQIRTNATAVVVLGTGGSSLGGQMLASLNQDGVFGQMAPKLYFIDNIDPDTFDKLLRHLDVANTVFIVISKSGRTVSTISQFLVCLSAFAAASANIHLKDRFIVITEPSDNPLRNYATALSIPVLDHDPEIGGRFSVLSVVGQLPAMIAGLDSKALLEGAESVLCSTLNTEDPNSSEVARGAAVTVALMKECKIAANVLMPYCDRLRSFTLWYRQLVAESLGKDGIGITPIDALGTVDQHSQLQLYLDGPTDKMFTLISVGTSGRGKLLSCGPTNETIFKQLDGHTIGDLMAVEYKATSQALIDKGRPVRSFHLSSLNENVLGALLMHFILETFVMADLLGVNAFDQPAVEKGKSLALQYLADL